MEVPELRNRAVVVRHIVAVYVEKHTGAGIEAHVDKLHMNSVAGRSGSLVYVEEVVEVPEHSGKVIVGFDCGCNMALDLSVHYLPNMQQVRRVDMAAAA